MEGIYKTLNSWLKEKTSSGLYITFIIFYVTWNWKFFYYIFIEDESLLYKTRIEYVDALNHQYVFFNIFFWDSIINSLLDYGCHLLPPIFFTYIMIEYFPRVYNWSHDNSIKNHFKRKRTYDDELLKYEQSKTQNLENLKDEKVQQNEQIKKIEESLSVEEKWELEYQDFKKTGLYFRFPKISQVIYESAGNLGWGANRIIDVDLLAYANSSGLVNYDQDSNRISFTEKGNFFNTKFLNQKNLINHSK